MNKRNKLDIKSVILFLYIWLCVGFPMGLWVLLAGPSRWLSEHARNTGMEISEENLWGKLIILGYIIASFLLAWFFYYLAKRNPGKLLKIGIPVALGLIFFFSVYIFSFHPQKLISYSGTASEKILGAGTEKSTQKDGLEFVFGPFPSEEMMDSIKEQGFDAIISLLHELVVPAEPALLKKEIELGRKVGLNVINMPMLPWISGNEKTVEEIKQLASNGKGRYYVHCYLGRDRVNVFKSLVEKYKVEINEKQTLPARRLEELPQMERGKIFKLEDEVYLTPFPTDEEFFSYILNGHFNTVISLLDSTLNDNKSWILREKEIMNDYQIDYLNFSCSNFEMENLNRLKAMVSEKKKPIIIHAFKTDDPFAEYIISHY